MTELTDVIYQRMGTSHNMDSVSVISVVATRRYRSYDDARILVRRSVATESLRIWSQFYLWENDFTPFIVVGHEYDRSADTIVVEAVSVEYNLSRWPAIHTLGTTVFMDSNDDMFEWGDPYGEVANINLFANVMDTVWNRTVTSRYGRGSRIPKFTDLYYGWALNLHDDNRIYSDEAQKVPYYRIDRSMTIYDVLQDVLAKCRMGYIVRYIPPRRNNDRASGNAEGMYIDMVRPIYRPVTMADPFRVSSQSFTNSAYTIDVRDGNNFVIMATEDYVDLANATEAYSNASSHFLGYKETSTDDLFGIAYQENDLENMVYSPAKSIFQSYTFTVEAVSPTFQMNRDYIIGDAVYCHVPNVRDVDQAEGEFRWMQVVEQTTSWGPEGYRTYPTVAFPESGPGYDNTLEDRFHNSWDRNHWN